MKKMITPILLSLVIGFCMGYFMFQQYQFNSPLETVPVFGGNSKQELTFLQIGVYSSIDSMEKNLSGIENYIYLEQDSKYHAYVAITGNEKNITKITGYYQEKGYILYSKKLEVKSSDFVLELSKYDELLAKTEDLDTIRVIISNVLTKYKELVINKR